MLTSLSMGRFAFIVAGSVASLLLMPSSQAQQNLFPGYSATASPTSFPGFSPRPAQERLPGVGQSSITGTPLLSVPGVLSLDHLDPAQMSAADNEVVSNLSAELAKAAALSDFDISNPAWHYQQVVCPAFPEYVLLSFSHGADESGSSRFTAILPRNAAQVHVLTTYAHGLLPFEATWNRPGSFEVFNGMLRQQRGSTPLSKAPNWLLIGMCYAELSGYPVQVLNPTPLAEPTLDTLRLGANQPQMMLQPDHSADVLFSDVSRATVTTNWSLHFDQKGSLIAVSHAAVHQPSAIALKPQ